MVKQLDRTVVQDDTPTSVFIDDGSRPDDRLEERMVVCSQQSRDICILFKQHKRNKRESNVIPKCAHDVHPNAR